MVTIYLAREGSAYILEDAGHSLELHSPLRIRLFVRSVNNFRLFTIVSKSALLEWMRFPLSEEGPLAYYACSTSQDSTPLGLFPVNVFKKFPKYTELFNLSKLFVDPVTSLLCNKGKINHWFDFGSSIAIQSVRETPGSKEARVVEGHLGQHNLVVQRSQNHITIYQINLCYCTIM